MNTLSLVVPCRNEAHRLCPTAFLEAIASYPWLTFCFVDDGSTDKTVERLSQLANLSPSIHLLCLPNHQGKAEAVRRGVLYLAQQTTADLIGFWDADLATPLEELPGFMRHFQDSTAVKAVIGARWPHLGANITRSSSRERASALVKLLIRLLLRLPVYDTQCGAKVFTRDLANEIFRAPFRTRWLFDVELLVRIGLDRLLRNVKEQPLCLWRDVPGSKLSFLDSFRIFGELFQIAFAPPYRPQLPNGNLQGEGEDDIIFRHRGTYAYPHH